jgi:hypothetical protein
MNRVILNQGTKTDLSKMFEDLQNFSTLNMQNFIGLITDSCGVNAEQNSDGTMLGQELRATNISYLSYGNTNVYVNPGEALTSGLLYINVPTRAMVPVTTLSTGSHKLFLKHKYVYSEPTDSLSGFAYGLPEGSQMNTRARDSYEFVWDTNPGISGVLLADVNLTTTSPNWDFNITDCRASNVFKLRYESRVHTQNTDTHTTASAFYIGGGPGVGLPVVVSKPVTTPKNFRIVDMDTPTTSNLIGENTRRYLASSTATSTTAAVTMFWGWRYVKKLSYLPTRDLQLNQATVEIYSTVDGRINIAADELVGCHFFHPKGYDYVISANSSATSSDGRNATLLLTLAPYNHTTAITADDAEANLRPQAENCRIHFNADRYDIVAFPVVGGVPNEIARSETHVFGGDPVTYLDVIENYTLGETLLIKIRSWSNGAVSSWETLQQGAFTKAPPHESSISYNSPCLISIPQISSMGVSIGAVPSSTGFTVTVRGGWIGAGITYEVAYVEYPNYPDFIKDSPSTKGGSFSNTPMAITAAPNKHYVVAVRPLISGWAVAQPKFADVTSGGTDPGGNTGSNFAISMKTLSGKLVTDTPKGNHWMKITGSGLYSPAGTFSTAWPGDIQPGQYLFTSDKDFYDGDLTINAVNISGLSASPSYISVDLRDATFSTAWAPTAFVAPKVFEINTGPLGRRIGKFSQSNNYTITKITFNFDTVTWAYSGATHLLFRLYPATTEGSTYSRVISSAEVNARTLVIEPNFSVAMEAVGTREIILDLYDPDPARVEENYTNITGNVSVEYRSP